MGLNNQAIAYDQIGNPTSYRGYVYDSETGLYYLQSRYYDPEVGRFLNADDTGMLGMIDSPFCNNLFAYCENCHVMRCDVNGFDSYRIGKKDIAIDRLGILMTTFKSVKPRDTQ